jgi:hypothetical protein
VSSATLPSTRPVMVISRLYPSAVVKGFRPRPKPSKGLFPAPLSGPALRPARYSQGSRTLACGRPARQGPERAGADSGDVGENRPPRVAPQAHGVTVPWPSYPTRRRHGPPGRPCRAAPPRPRLRPPGAPGRWRATRHALERLPSERSQRVGGECRPTARSARPSARRG